MAGRLAQAQAAVPAPLARAAQLPAKTSVFSTTRPRTLVHLARSPLSKSSLKSAPAAGVVTEAVPLKPERLPAAS